MNSENSKTSQLHVLILKLTNKLYLRIGKNFIALSNLSIYCTWKNIITINLKNLHQHRMINLNYQMDRILYQIFKIILSRFDKPSLQKYVNKIENRVTIKIKNEYSLELLTSETMKLLGVMKTK